MVNLYSITAMHLTTFCLWSCHVTFQSSLTVQSYARELNILTTALTKYSILIPNDLVGSLLIGSLKI